jgi:hypothetical protein
MGHILPDVVEYVTAIYYQKGGMGMNEREDYMKFLPAGLVVIMLGVAALILLRRPRKPRSFREDPVGALKDRSQIVAGKAQEATEEALARIQETIEEIRGRLPDVNRKQFDKRRKQINQRLAVLSDQAQDLLKELRANSPLNR